MVVSRARGACACDNAGYQRDETGLDLDEVQKLLSPEALEDTAVDTAVLAEGIDSVRGGWPPQKCASLPCGAA